MVQRKAVRLVLVQDGKARLHVKRKQMDLGQEVKVGDGAAILGYYLAKEIEALRRRFPSLEKTGATQRHQCSATGSQVRVPLSEWQAFITRERQAA